MEGVPQPTAAQPRLRERVLRAGGWAVAGFAADKLVAAGQLVVLARLLTPSDFGLMAASSLVLLTLVTLAEVGVETTLVAHKDVTDDDLAVAFTIALARGAFLAGCLWIFAGVTAQAMRMPELAALLRVQALALLIQGVQSPALALLVRNLNLSRRVQLDLMRRVIEATATICLALWLRNVWSLLIGQLIGFAVGSLLSYWVAPAHPRLSLHKTALARFLRFGKMQNLTAICIFGVMNGGEFVVARVLGADALGVYQIAQAIPLLVGVRATLLLSQVSFPLYSLLREDHGGKVRAFTVQIGVVGALVIPLAVGVALMASEVVGLLFGARWSGAVVPMQWLCVYAVCAALSGVMASLHYGSERPDLQTRIWVRQFAVYAITIVPFTVRFGLAGAAAALSLSYVAGLVLHARYTVKLFGEAARTVFGALGRVVGPSVLLGSLVAVLARVLSTTQGSAWVLVSAALGAAMAWSLYQWQTEYRKLASLWNSP